MCIFCGGQCGGIGEFLAPLIGMGAVMIIVKFENRLRGYKHKLIRKIWPKKHDNSTKK